jgi:hypothetical protein
MILRHTFRSVTGYYHAPTGFHSFVPGGTSVVSLLRHSHYHSARHCRHRQRRAHYHLDSLPVISTTTLSYSHIARSLSPIVSQRRETLAPTRLVLCYQRHVTVFQLRTLDFSRTHLTHHQLYTTYPTPRHLDIYDGRRHVRRGDHVRLRDVLHALPGAFATAHSTTARARHGLQCQVP